jgi:dihydrofolate synthase/folylpolyglutamate synthase
LILLDCAHNVASAQALANALVESFPVTPPGRRHLIFAGSKDKDLAGMLSVLGPLFDHVYFTRFANPRCCPAPQLAQMLPVHLAGRARLCDDAGAALTHARISAGPADLICAAGSVFLAGELRSFLLSGTRIHDR